MIRRIYSTLPSFKELKPHAGLNILLVEKSPEATERHTRNRAGKTSLIETIHFLLGAKYETDSIFRSEKLSKHYFGLELELGGKVVSVERSGEDANKLIVRGETTDWPIKPTKERKTGNLLISNGDWRSVLGHFLFGLPDSGPSFRSVFPYFARRQLGSGFLSFERYDEDEQLGDQQTSISFLLGLDWTIPKKWQQVRDKEKTLKELKSALKKGTLGPLIEKSGTLRTKLAVQEKHVHRLREDLSGFRVLPEYRELEKEAADIVGRLNSLANENTLDHELIKMLENALTKEGAADVTLLKEMYRQAGLDLSEVTLRRFEETQKFHESVLANRRSYLEMEVDAAQKRILERDEAKTRLDARRLEIMEVLQTGGALDQFTRLHSELNKREAAAEGLKQQYQLSEQLESTQTKLDLDRNQLLLRLRQDHRERAAKLNDAIVTFEDLSKALLQEAGSLTVRETLNGPDFAVEIHGSRSKGITNMQIFCFDMMLAALARSQSLGIDFLVHDSHLFDPMDSRQVATALMEGAKVAKRHSFQYLVTMNSDALPTNFPKDFSVASHLLPVKLTDAEETGGLFGLKF